MNLVVLDKGTGRVEGVQHGNISANYSVNNPPPRPDSRKNRLFDTSQPNDKQSEKGSFFNFK
jgi:hypothetical protein